MTQQVTEKSTDELWAAYQRLIAEWREARAITEKAGAVMNALESISAIEVWRECCIRADGAWHASQDAYAAYEAAMKEELPF